jgi:hypothetical protein
MHLVHTTQSMKINVLGFMFYLSKTDNINLYPLLLAVNTTRSNSESNCFEYYN